MEVKEANIVINGVTLSFAQSMTLRVALSSFLLEMRDPNALGNDAHGTAMTHLYAARSEEIIQLIFRNLR